MRRLRLAVTVVCTLVLISSVGLASTLTSKQRIVLSDHLQSSIADKFSNGALFDVLITVDDRSTTDIQRMAASAHSLSSRYRSVSDELHMTSTKRHQDFKRIINTLPATSVQIQREFWIANIVHARVTREALLVLASNDGVVRIDDNGTVDLMPPVRIAEALESAAGAQPNLGLIGARALWARGLTGAGRLVGSIDTGVEGDHPALRHGWRGLQGDTAAAWFDPLNGSTPIDNNGHGTHVMGVMVGHNGADTIGLAPDAEWISAAVIDRGRSLAVTFADIIAALQWSVDPDGNPQTTDDVPDVLCNSWGVSQQVINPCDELFFNAIDNVEALGVVCVFAAGNEGPFSMSMRNPADRGSTPTASFSVGACDLVDGKYTVPSFSSRGPSACDGVAIKPELVAPGVRIRSAYKDGTYKEISGTSMAAPHVAAAVTLLRQYNPDLTPEEIKLALLSTARDIDLPGEDNSSGAGMLDLEAALSAVRPPLSPNIVVANVSPDPFGDAILAPGETGDLCVGLLGNGAAASTLTARIKALTPGVTITLNSSFYGDLPEGATVNNESAPFLVNLSNDLQRGDMLWFELSITGSPGIINWIDTVGFICGLPAASNVFSFGDGQSAITLSNFGHLGLGPTSILDAGGEGWHYPGSTEDLLYEAALMITDADGHRADASRQSSGEAQFDFRPVEAPTGLSAAWGEPEWFDDSHADLPVGVTVVQQAIESRATATYEWHIVSWTVYGRLGFPMTGLQIGWLLDIDRATANGISELIQYDPISGDGIVTTPNGGGRFAGIMSLGFAPGTVQFYDNGTDKVSLSTWQKEEALHSGLSDAPRAAGDFFTIMATPSLNVPAGESMTVALAFITADDLASWADASQDAHDSWVTITGVNDELGEQGLIDGFTLGSNYPNPFNAATRIPLVLSGSGYRQVRLEIYDILGRRVRTLVDGQMRTGHHSVEWNGTNNDGHPLASGVYLSRLIVDGDVSEARQMVLLK